MMERGCILCGSRIETIFRLPESDLEIVQCNACHIVFKSSILDRSQPEIEEMYDSEEYWSTNQCKAEKANYDDRHKRVKIYHRLLRTLEMLNSHKGQLLDVGCSKGVFLDIARQEGYQPHGLEISSRAAQCARDSFDVEVFTGTLGEAPWPEASFDVITMLDVIEHLPAPSLAVALSSKLLKDGGILIIETPNTGSLFHRIAGFMWRRAQIKSLFLKLYGVRNKGGHVVFFTQDTLAHLLKIQGFDVIHVDFDPVGHALWRPMSPLERLANYVDNAVGGLLGGKYHMMVFARKIQ